eukprot:106649-Rhodomonas_salina.2
MIRESTNLRAAQAGGCFPSAADAVAGQATLVKAFEDMDKRANMGTPKQKISRVQMYRGLQVLSPRLSPRRALRPPNSQLSTTVSDVSMPSAPTDQSVHGVRCEHRPHTRCRRRVRVAERGAGGLQMLRFCLPDDLAKKMIRLAAEDGQPSLPPVLSVSAPALFFRVLASFRALPFYHSFRIPSVLSCMSFLDLPAGAWRCARGG